MTKTLLLRDGTAPSAAIGLLPDCSGFGSDNPFCGCRGQRPFRAPAQTAAIWPPSWCETGDPREVKPNRLLGCSREQSQRDRNHMASDSGSKRVVYAALVGN